MDAPNLGLPPAERVSSDLRQDLMATLLRNSDSTPEDDVDPQSPITMPLQGVPVFSPALIQLWFQQQQQQQLAAAISLGIAPTLPGPPAGFPFLVPPPLITTPFIMPMGDHAPLLSTPPAVNMPFKAPPVQPTLQSLPPAPNQPVYPPAMTMRMEPIPRVVRKKRARILNDGQLTMIVYGANEALTWARRVTHFRQTMKAVLGDRSKNFIWYGSVTDSVVGAFLTQNVSDALSSRAYMEVASRWPSTGMLLRDKLLLPRIDGDAPTLDVSDTVDWSAVRLAPTEDLSDAIKCRGMQRMLAIKIQSFLDFTKAINIQRSLGSLVSAVHEIDLEVLNVMAGIVGVLEQAAGEGPEDEGDVDAAVLQLLDALEVAHEGETVPETSQISPPASSRRRSQSPVELEYEADEDSSLLSVPKEPSCDNKLTRLYHQHRALTESSELSLEWLRDVPDDEAREFLMGVNGLGRKSVACIMLLTLGKKEFPVDVNVGRICARLGWIPLESSQAIEDMDDYAPEPEVHAYLRSRLLDFDIETLYELHYQMITLGKVFCSKANPNCLACPMRDVCEYALHNGPSLHGRKKIKVQQPSPQFPGEEILEMEMEYEDDYRMWPSSVRASDVSLPKVPISRPAASTRFPVPLAPGEQIHWKTRRRLERLAREQEERERLYSILSLDDLIEARHTRPRTRGMRWPRGQPPPHDLLQDEAQRASRELQWQVDVAVRRLPRVGRAKWLPLDLMRLQPDEHPSAWDEASEDATVKAADADMAWLETADGVVAHARSQRAAVVQRPSNVSPLPGLRTPSVWDRVEEKFIYQQPKPLVIVSVPVVNGGGGAQVAKTAVSLAPSPDAPAVASAAAGSGGPANDALSLDFEPPSGAAIDLIPLPEGMSLQDDVGVALDLQAEEPLCLQLSLEDLVAAQDEVVLLAAGTPPGAEESITRLASSEAYLTQESIDEQPLSLESGDICAVENPHTGRVPLVPPPVSLPNNPPAAAAAASQGVFDVAAECERLQAIGSEMADVYKAQLTLAVGANADFHVRRLLELSLKALDINTSMAVDSIRSVASAARRKYHLFARSLHPDRCTHPGADAAFAALGRAMAVVTEHSMGAMQTPECLGTQEESLQSQEEGEEGMPEADELALGSVLLDGALSLWNPSRLVVQAHILPSHMYARFPEQLHSYDLLVNGEAQLLFVPLASLPTMQNDVATIRRPLPLDTNEVAVRDTMEAMIQEIESSQGCALGGISRSMSNVACEPDAPSLDEDVKVEGVLLVNCRAALRGRFPLNGTYFQINEVFADYATVECPVLVPSSLLAPMKTCAVYFGLGIHYLTKGMTQQEVAHMFTHGSVCFRSFCPRTRAPMKLPDVLMPTIPTQSKTKWKNKDERAAEKEAKAAAMAARGGHGGVGVRPLLPAAYPASRPWDAQATGASVRLVPPVALQSVPPIAASDAQYVPNAVPKILPAQNNERPWLHASLGPSTPASKQKKRPRVSNPQSLGGDGQPRSVSAADAKSGKGMSRRHLFPAIRAGQRCGVCGPCLNPKWKKPCDVRRAEMLQSVSMHTHAPIE